MNESGIFHKNDFSNLTFIRIIRFNLAAIIVLFLIANIFGVGIASAETGGVIVESESSYTTEPTTGAAGGATDFTKLQFDVANWNYIEEYYISFTNPNDAFLLQANSTFFTCVSPNVCNGVVSYNRLGNILLWDFATGADITVSPITMTYEVNIFDAYNIGQGTQVYAAESVGGNIPVCLSNSYSASRCAYGISGGVPVRSISATNSTVGFSTSLNYNITYPMEGKFSGSIDKEGAILNKVTLVNDIEDIYYAESTFTSTDFVLPLLTYGNGLWINVSLSSGAHTLQLINASGATTGVPPDTDIPVPDPITGVGIVFDYADYFKGDIANISWIRLEYPPFGYRDDVYLYEPDGASELLVSSPSNTGYVKVLVSEVGTYEVKFIRSVFGLFPETLASDTATVGQEDPSYIYAPANVAVGKLFNATYKLGFTPSNAFIETQFYNSSGGWEHELYFSTNQQRGVEANASILVKRPGRYLIVLGDAIGGMKASTQTTAFFNGTDPVLNISLSNISIDKSAYSYGEHMKVNVFVDNFNWSNKQVYVDSYNWEYNIAQSQQQIQDQHEVFDQFISDITFASPGVSSMRLMGRNDTGTYVLAYTNFTLSELDTEGYGLSLSSTEICMGDTVYIRVVVPSGTVANLSVSSDNVIENKDWNINGSKVVPYTFKNEESYYITLRVGGEAKRIIIVNADLCIIPTPVPTPLSGAGQALQIASLLTSSIFWSLIITAGLMIAIAWKTKDGFPTGTIGMLSAGMFSYIGWLPLWIFFSALIIAALFIAGSIVSKQLSKLG